MKPINECKTVEELLGAGPERWTKGESFQDAEGNRWTLDEHKKGEPVCFCVEGAISYIYGSRQGMVQSALLIVKNLILVNAICEWNDAPERTYEEVMSIVRKAGI